MKKYLIFTLLSLSFCGHLSAQNPADELSHEAVREALDLTTDEGCETFLFYHVASAFFGSIESTQHFPPEKRTALARSWAPYLHQNFSYEHAAPLLKVALGVENPYGSCCTDSREQHLKVLETYGEYTDVANAVAWFLLSSSNEHDDHVQALNLLQARKDLSVEGLDTLGYAYYKLKQYEDALHCFFEAMDCLDEVEMSTEDPLAPLKRLNIFYHMGETLFAMDHKKEALVAWSKTLKGLDDLSDLHQVDVEILAIGLNVDYKRLRKLVQALRVIVKKEEAKAIGND
jgi:tetratricopeptide (TPR) repeat protein